MNAEAMMGVREGECLYDISLRLFAAAFAPFFRSRSFKKHKELRI